MHTKKTRSEKRVIYRGDFRARRLFIRFLLWISTETRTRNLRGASGEAPTIKRYRIFSESRGFRREKRSGSKLKRPHPTGGRAIKPPWKFDWRKSRRLIMLFIVDPIESENDFASETCGWTEEFDAFVCVEMAGGFSRQLNKQPRSFVRDAQTFGFM